MRSWSEKGETSQTKRKRQKESYELKKNNPITFLSAVQRCYFLK